MSAPQKWFRVLVYPFTKRGEFTAVVQEVEGYHWHCRKHEKPQCRGCRNYERSKVVRTLHAVPTDPNAEVVRALLQAVASLEPEWCEVDDDGVPYLRAD